MSTLPQGDLAALDGPDDWVSLFLNDVGEELVEFQVSNIHCACARARLRYVQQNFTFQDLCTQAPHTTATTSASVSEQSRFDQAAPAGSSGSARYVHCSWTALEHT